MASLCLKLYYGWPFFWYPIHCKTNCLAFVFSRRWEHCCPLTQLPNELLPPETTSKTIIAPWKNQKTITAALDKEKIVFLLWDRGKTIIASWDNWKTVVAFCNGAQGSYLWEGSLFFRNWFLANLFFRKTIQAIHSGSGYQPFNCLKGQ